MKTVKDYMAIITIYGPPNGKIIAVEYRWWSANTISSDMDLSRIKNFIKEGVCGEKIKEYVISFGCVIQILECKEIKLLELEPIDFR